MQRIALRLAACAGATALVATGPSVSTAMAATIEPALTTAAASAAPGTSVPVIIRLSAEVLEDIASSLSDLESRGRGARAALVAWLEEFGIEDAIDLWIINGIAVRLPPDLLPLVAELSVVERISLDALVTEPVADPATESTVEWNVDRLGAPVLWGQGVDGAGSVVGVMGSGVDLLHPDLTDRWLPGGWWDPYTASPEPMDLSGHDTAVASIAVGGSAGGTAIGVAPGAQWMAARIFGPDNRASYSTIHAAFQWFADPDGDPATDDAPDVVNASWSFGEPGTCDREFEADVTLLREHGTAVIFSAGNTGPGQGTSVSPANYSGSIAVGATDALDGVAGFSGRGPSACDGATYPDIVAPGRDILAADSTIGGFYTLAFQQVEGTSAAAPHVAGAMALLRQAVPGISVRELEEVLRRGAFDIGPAGPDADAGAGRLDVVAALDAYRAETASGDPDWDADGYPASQDCDDWAAAVHPDAPETKHDGVDQDCNGYDLTIDVLTASYDTKRQSLEVVATSALGADAALQVAGFGAMTFKSRKGEETWSLSARKIPDPGTVTIFGPEGSVTTTPAGS